MARPSDAKDLVQHDSRSYRDHLDSTHQHLVSSAIISPPSRKPLIVSSFTCFCLVPQSAPRFNTHSCGAAVIGGLVQYVFSAPARIDLLCSSHRPRPRRWAKNALHYVAPRFMLRRQLKSPGAAVISVRAAHNQRGVRAATNPSGRPSARVVQCCGAAFAEAVRHQGWPGPWPSSPCRPRHIHALCPARRVPTMLGWC